jgi:Integral membrane protein
VVADQHDAVTGRRILVLRPNVALSRRQTVLAFGAIAATSLTVATAFAAAGFWPVLPFAGLEIALLGWALRVSATRAEQEEVIVLQDGRVEVWQGRGRRCRWVSDGYWTEVALVPPTHRWYPSRLRLRSRGTEVELGEFLQDEERAELARRLKRLIGPMAAPGERV